MMPFEVSCGNFKCCNKFLFYSTFHVSIFFYPKDIPVPVFASSFIFFNAHYFLYRHAKKKKEERNTRNLEKNAVMGSVYISSHVSRSFEVFVSLLHILSERPFSV